MKRIWIPLFASLLAMSALVGCGRTADSSSAPASEATEVTESATSATAETEPPSEAASDDSTPTEDVNNEVSIDRILMAIEAAYGDDYPINSEIPTEVMEAEFGLSSDLYVDAKGEMAMISVQNDRVVVAQAAPGKADDLEAALQAARQRKVDDTLQYPANIPKTNAAKVVRHGDFVAFLLVGVTDDSIDDITSEETRQYYEDQVQKAVDAFNGVFVA